MNLLDLVVGKPIKTSDERAEQVGPAQGVPIFGLDGLSSAAYGPEAALSLLIPLGLVGVRYIVPVSAASGVSLDQRYSWDDGRSLRARGSQSTRNRADGSIRSQSAKDCTRL